MTLSTQKTPAPQTQQAQAPAEPQFQPPGTDNTLLGGALGLVGAVVPDIQAADWVEAVRKMGPLGTVVLDAQPADMLEHGLPRLVDLPVVQSWVYGALRDDPATLSSASHHWLLSRLLPVGNSLGVEGHGNLTCLADPRLRGRVELFRTGREDYLTEAEAELTVALSSGAGLSVTGAFEEPLAQLGAGLGGGVQLSLVNRQELAFGSREMVGLLLEHGLVEGTLTGGWKAALADAVVRELAGSVPETARAQVVAQAGALLASTDLESALPDFLSPQGLGPLDCGALGSLLTSLGGSLTAGLEISDGRLQVLCVAAAGVGLDWDLGLLAALPGMSELVACLDGAEAWGRRELRVDVEPSSLLEGSPQLRFASLRVQSSDGEELLFDHLASALSFLTGSTTGMSVGQAIRNAGLLGLSHSVSLPLDEEGADFPMALELLEDLLPDRNVVAAREEVCVEFSARVDAERLAQLLDPVVLPPGRAPATAAMEAMRAALDMTRGVRPPDWITRKVEQADLRRSVAFDKPRLVGRIRLGIGLSGSAGMGPVVGAGMGGEAWVAVDRELPRSQASRVWPLVGQKG